MTAAVFLWLSPRAEAVPELAPPSLLDRGFSELYNLNFDEAQKDFAAWEAQNSENPLGPVSEAAGYLFSEFHRLGVLEAQFYEDDNAFIARSKRNADPAVKNKFQAALERAEQLANARLPGNPRDRDALFALTLSSGLKADYAALIEKRNLASLHYTKEASGRAQQLLASCADCYDALLATGFSKYVIGSMSAPVRWFLRVGGFPGDKQAGIAELQTAADRGHYLAPFAHILLAIAYVRQKDKARALQELTALHSKFPANTLIEREIARLEIAH